MMPFKYLVNFLGDKRLRRRLVKDGSSDHVPQSELPWEGRDGRDYKKENRAKGPVRRDSSITKRRDRARTIHSPKGWSFEASKRQGNSSNLLKTKKFASDWLLEFECPRCGETSSEGVNHWDVRRGGGHIKYEFYLDCKNCGWQSDPINIRAYE